MPHDRLDEMLWSSHSEKYFDDEFEYRHVVLPAEVAARLPKGQLLLEHEWRELGVQQSRGWLHYRCGKGLLACVWHRNISLHLCGPHGEVGIGANILKTWSMCVHPFLKSSSSIYTWT